MPPAIIGSAGVHPRACGGARAFPARPASPEGSSPRARRELGGAASPISASAYAPLHPRARGASRVLDLVERRGPRSSPRARGELGGSGARMRYCGSSPPVRVARPGRRLWNLTISGRWPGFLLCFRFRPGFLCWPDRGRAEASLAPWVGCPSRSRAGPASDAGETAPARRSSGLHRFLREHGHPFPGTRRSAP